MPDEMAAVASTSAAAAASAIKAAKRALRKSMAETLRNVSSEQLAVQCEHYSASKGRALMIMNSCLLFCDVSQEGGRPRAPVT